MQVEQEEEFLTNTLQKKLEKVTSHYCCFKQIHTGSSSGSICYLLSHLLRCGIEQQQQSSSVFQGHLHTTVCSYSRGCLHLLGRAAK